MTDDLLRRIEALERQLDNGRFIRKDVFDVVLHDVRNDYQRIAEELGAIRGSIKDERTARENDRRGLRNLFLAAFLAALGSLSVSLVIANTLT